MVSTDSRLEPPGEKVIEHPLGTAYLDGLLALSASAHWNQDETDWRWLLEAGVGWGLSMPDGTVVACAVALPYPGPGGGFGWVSMVLVLPEQRRHGHASRLLDRAIQWLINCDLTPILDATPAGRAVYGRAGFGERWGFERWERAGGSVRGEAGGSAIRALGEADWPEVLALDAVAFGGDREALLRSLAARRPDLARVAVRDGRIEGAVFGRSGRTATQLGPLLADDDAVAAALLDAALAGLPGRVFADAPVPHTAFAAALAERGFVRQRPFTRMVLETPQPHAADGAGDARTPAPGDPSRLRLVAGPELG